jgi:hypothetical protein
MLPAMGPLVILLAQVAVRVGRTLLSHRQGAWWRGLLVAHCAGFGAAAVIMASRSVGKDQAQWLMACLAAIAAIVIAGLIWWMRSPAQSRAMVSMSLCALAALALFVTMAESKLLWRRRRFNEADFARAVAAQVKDGDPLAAWRWSWEVGIHYADRVIPVIKTPGRLNAALERAPPGNYWIITHGEDRPPDQFPQRLCAELRDSGQVQLRLWALGPVDNRRIPLSLRQ